jgi:hypothetical protein
MSEDRGAATTGGVDPMHPSRRVPSAAMGELSEDSESSAGVKPTEGGQGGSDQTDRPKLVALPGPAAAEPAPAPDDAEPASRGAAAEPEPESAAAPAAEPAPAAESEVTSATAAAAAAESEPAPAAAASTHADRLALERSLGGPPGSRVVGGPAHAAARTIDLAAPTPVSAYADWAPRPHGVADAIALTATPELLQALRDELAMRAHAEAGLRARAVDAETRLVARVLLTQRTVETLDQVRAELDQLAELLTDERARRRAAEQRVAELERQLAADRGRSDDADREIAALRDSLQRLRSPAEDHDTAGPGGGSPDDVSPGAGTEVRADRLSDALTRLRAGAEPIDPVPVPAGPVAPVALTPATADVALDAPRATLAGPFRTLCRRDPTLAGQLALSLLPMQRIAYPQPISYDVVLGPGHGCVQVTSDQDGTEIARQATARPLQQVDLHVVGGLERFAKLLAAGRIRRRLGFGVARVRGNRDGVAALDALLALPLDLPALVAGGMSTDPSILVSLVAAMVTPNWTRGARFSISHRDGNAPATYLLIADGRLPIVTTVAPTGPIPTVISCAQSDLASALTGSPAPEPELVQVLGDPAPLAQLQAWIKRAQSE